MYADSLTLERARAEFFAQTGYSERDYNRLIAKFQVGPFPLWIYNFKSRRQATAIHDVHHVLTGYDTSLVGEGQISAWELGSGYAPGDAAILFILLGTLTGLVVDRKKTWAAFKRGVISRNLYGRRLTPQMMKMSLGELRAELGL